MKEYIVVVVEVKKGKKYSHTVSIDASHKWDLFGKLYDKFGEEIESLNIIREE